MQKSGIYVIVNLTGFDLILTRRHTSRCVWKMFLWFARTSWSFAEVWDWIKSRERRKLCPWEPSLHWLAFIHLIQAQIIWNREPSLGKCFIHVGLWTHLWGIFLIDVGRPSPLWAMSTWPSGTELYLKQKQQEPASGLCALCFSSCFQVPALLEFLPWLSSMMDCDQNV